MTVAQDAQLAESTVQEAEAKAAAMLRAAAARLPRVRASVGRRSGEVSTMTPDPAVLAEVRQLADGDLQRVSWRAEGHAVVWNSRRQRRQLGGPQ